MDEKISKVEIELLSAAIDRIVMQEVLEDELLGTLPKVDELNDSNKIYRGKVSVLFVDMRESTKLPEKRGSTKFSATPDSSGDKRAAQCALR